VVISLRVSPSVCFGKILKSSDEICCGNGILALGSEEFRNLVLLYPEVEIGRSISAWRCCGGGRACGVASAVVVPVEIDIAIIVVVVVVIIFRGHVDIITSGSGHFAVQSFIFSYKNSYGFSDPCCGL